MLIGENVHLENKWVGKIKLNRSAESESFPALLAVVVNKLE